MSDQERNIANELEKFKIRQLDRALSQKISFMKAYFVIYSDYPTAQSLNNIVDHAEGELKMRIFKEIAKIAKSDY